MKLNLGFSKDSTEPVGLPQMFGMDDKRYDELHEKMVSAWVPFLSGDLTLGDAILAAEEAANTPEEFAMLMYAFGNIEARAQNPLEILEYLRS